jgi:hypothetical protein
MAEKTPEERTAAAQKLRDEGDPRPVSQIEGEMLAQEQLTPEHAAGEKDEKDSGK